MLAMVEIVDATTKDTMHIKIILFLLFLLATTQIFFLQKAFALTQCQAENGVCTSYSVCHGNGYTGQTKDNQGNPYQCQKGTICCNATGQLPVCNTHKVCTHTIYRFTQYNGFANIVCH